MLKTLSITADITSILCFIFLMFQIINNITYKKFEIYNKDNENNDAPDGKIGNFYIFILFLNIKLDKLFFNNKNKKKMSITFSELKGMLISVEEYRNFVKENYIDNIVNIFRF
jgi:hypothetical protein